MTPFVLQPQSVHHEILERLCAMAKPVRGIAEAMLNRSYNNPRAIQELAQAGLIRERGNVKAFGAGLTSSAGEMEHVMSGRTTLLPYTVENVIDHNKLAISVPEMLYDLTANGKRLVQRAAGYVATLVAGEVTFRHGEATGARPGKLVRGAQAAPTR